jgi:hypothetical protein
VLGLDREMVDALAEEVEVADVGCDSLEVGEAWIVA